MKGARFWTIIGLMLVTLGMLLHRGDADNVPPSDPLSQIPMTIDGMTAQDVPLDDEVLQVLGKGDFLNRTYAVTNQSVADQRSASMGTAANYPVGLFIGYFATQRTGQTMHSPLHCLPGAGWVFESKRYATIKDTTGKDYNVGEYVINNGEIRQFVIYWYQSHGRSIANEYRAKAYMLADAIRSNRTDGAIVRVITPMAQTESIDSARQRALSFTTKLTPQIPRFIPN